MLLMSSQRIFTKIMKSVIVTLRKLGDNLMSSLHDILYGMKISRFRGRVQKTAKLKCREKSFNGQPRN